MQRSITQKIPQGLVVSCQLDRNEPLNSPQHCSLFAQAAAMGGAVAIRADGVNEIKEIRATVRLPIIGCERTSYDDGSPLSTPDMDSVDRLVRLGVDVLAIDATERRRPGAFITGSEFIEIVRKRYPGILLLGDISTVEEVQKAKDAGVDAVSTVLFGRTPETFDQADSIDSHIDFVSHLSSAFALPIFAEGFIWSQEDAARSMESGAYGVIVGGAITRPRVLTRLFADTIGSTLEGYSIDSYRT